MANREASPEKWDAVLRMQRYIQDHLKAPITQCQLARAAGYSGFYAARLFKELTGATPFEYIRRLRLTHSAASLREDGTRVLDVALDYVFDSHEGFTRAFSKEFGVTPREYQKHPRPLNLFMPRIVRVSCPIKHKGEESMSANSNAIFVQVVDRPTRKFILKRGRQASEYFEYCEEVGCDVWGLLCGIEGALYEPVGAWMPDNLRPEGTSLYVQGVEVPADYAGPTPEGFEVIDLPPCKMMIFQGPPFEEEKFSEAIGELWKQTADFNPEIYGFRWDEPAAPKIQLAPMGYRGYIEGRPVAPCR